MSQPVPFNVLRYRWVILGLCVGCFLFTFITRFAWPPLIPVMVPILGMKMSQAGAFMSAFYLGYIITQIPAGVMADKFGVRLILGMSLIVEGVSTSALSFMNSYETGFALRVLSGLGAGAGVLFLFTRLNGMVPAPRAGQSVWSTPGRSVRWDFSDKRHRSAIESIRWMAGCISSSRLVDNICGSDGSLLDEYRVQS